MPSKDDPPLPVIIAGAGPCGLAAALTLQKSDVPFVIYERAAASRLCSNAGSGIDMAPTAIEILEDRLGIGSDLGGSMRSYEYMHMLDMDGRAVKTFRLRDLGEKGKIYVSKDGAPRSFGFANRSDLQHALLRALGLQDEGGDIRADTNGALRCGVAVTGYRNADDCVEVELSDGAKVRGCALLACDGIHSAVRKQMYRAVDDPLRYCGQQVWWGKTAIEPGSVLDGELRKLSEEHDMEDGNVSLMVMGTRRRPGWFFSCEVAENVHAWAYFAKSDAPPPANASDDLTRRGGTALRGEAKRREIDALAPADRPAIVRAIMAQTREDDVTRAGLFDRGDGRGSYVDGRVALLGDAAHPQSPMMGQGANMAVVDGYVAATRLADAAGGGGRGVDVEGALAAYDCAVRRKDNAVVVRKARRYGRWVASGGRFACWATRVGVKYMPASSLIRELVSGDKSNKKFVASMRRDLGVAL